MTMTASPIPKNGMCPSGWDTSGNYCIAGPNAKEAIPKSGMCPLGWSPSGNYCLKN